MIFRKYNQINEVNGMKYRGTVIAYKYIRPGGIYIDDATGEVTEFNEYGIISKAYHIKTEDVNELNRIWEELSKTYDIFGFPEYPIDPVHNVSCSGCEYCIWTSHFKYCNQLQRELNNWFRIDARLKDCPFRFD
jgi:hypothetical protein